MNLEYHFDDAGVLHIELPDGYEAGHIYVNGEPWSVSEK